MRLIVFYCFLLGFVPVILVHPYAGVLLYSLISFMSPHKLMWEFPAAIQLAMIAAILTFISWLLSKEPKRLPLNGTVWLILAFMVIISFTTSLALDPAPAYAGWEQTMKALLFVLVTIALTTNRVRFHALLWVMAISIGYYGLKGGLFTLVYGGQYLAFGPRNTAIENNNNFGGALLVAVPLMNYIRLNSAYRWVRLGWLVVMAASFLCAAGSYSRSAFLGMIAMSAWLWLKSRKGLISAVLIVLTVVSMLAFMPEQYIARLYTIKNYEQDSSAMSRFDIWGVAIKMAKALPLTGAGFRATESQAVINRFDPSVVSRAVHNIFLCVLTEHGIIGFLIWIALLVGGWRNSRWIVRHSQDRPEWQWADDFARMSQVAIVGYIVAGSFHNTQYWDYYFTIIGLLAAARTMMERAALPQISTAVPSGAFSRMSP